MKLYPYQQEAVDKTISFLKNQLGNPLVVAPTGSGKSLMIAAICKDIREKRVHLPKILILAHRKELLVQNASAIKTLNPSATVGFYSASIGHKSLSEEIIVAGIGTIARIPKWQLTEFDFIMIDEAHLVNTLNEGQYRKLIAYFPKARIIGFSATPFRLKGGLLHKSDTRIFTDIVVDIPLEFLMKEGFLSLLRSKSSAVEADLSGLHTRMGEFIQNEYDPIFNNKDLIKRTVDDILIHAKSRNSWLIFCSSVEHAYNVKHEINQRSIVCQVITGETPKIIRDEIIEDFKDRKIKAITNCDVLTVGFDAPNIDLIVLLRPTQSCGLYIQSVGRGARLYSGKNDCMVLDYAGNIERFGPIDHIKLKEDSSGRIVVEDNNFKICPDCRECIALAEKICPVCQYQYPSREVIREIKHDMVASNLEILSSKIIKTKYDGVQLLEIFDYKFYLNEIQDKPTSIRIDYYTSKNDFVSEWVCIEHQGFAKENAIKWWEIHGNNLPLPESAEEMLQLKDQLKLPNKISVEIKGNYSVICEKTYYEG